MNPVPVAFYAPLKSPRHPAPSGDRTMARLLLAALAKAGFEPDLATELRSLDKAGDLAVQERLRAEGQREAAALVERYRALDPGRRPRLWFTYHVYYKAPDWIGPQVADALGIPYVIAEGSRARKRAEGPWAVGHRGAEAALDRADAVFVMTAHDRPALEAARPPAQLLIPFPPFLDADAGDPPPRRTGCALLSVAMMREGDKLASYRILAEALNALADRAWTLDIVGDGEARPVVERLFEHFGARVRFRGRIDEPEALRHAYEAADLFVWPAVNEAYGMVLLEAQARGCPVVAGAFGGVPEVVRDGETGLLATPGDPAAFAGAIRTLLADPERRASMGMAANRFVRDERSLARAAARLAQALRPLVLEAA
ncbi:MAG TPA: glycosyltransferase family 4 protein [Microvirga sp.]|jgi:glycosyltransferase involved in cell wall biosynthesis